MEQRYETKESFDVVGMNISTTIKETKNKIEIPQLWGNFHKRFNEIQNRKGDKIFFGICDSDDPTWENFDYCTAVEVNSVNDIPTGMISKKIPNSKYAVFLHKGDFMKIGETWDKAMKEWLPSSDKKYNEEGISFELYDERFTMDENNICEIWIPIKE